MDLQKYHMHITGRLGSIFLLDISQGQKRTLVAYSFVTGFLAFLGDDLIADMLQRNLVQFRKLLQNKRPYSYYIGFQLNFVLRNNKDVEAFNDKNNILAVDYRGAEPETYAIKEPQGVMHEIFTDGSYLKKRQRGGYAVLIKNPGGRLRLLWGQTREGSNNLIELLAAIEGLRALNDVQCIRVISDSRYVIKGLAEWVVNWKLNNWLTANGEPVKNITYWQAFDALAQGKYIEFAWVKGHNNHLENTLSDYYAKLAAAKK